MHNFDDSYESTCQNQKYFGEDFRDFASIYMTKLGGGL